MTKFVVSGYIGFDNFGDEAIANVLTSWLKSNNAEKVTLISSNPEKTAKLYGVNSVGMFKFFKPILESDVLISGGGSLLQDITSLKSLVYYLTIIFTALLLRKKVIIFAQGFTPFRTKIGKILTKFILKKCHQITVRDSESQKLLSEMQINSELICDPAFGIQTNSENHYGVGIQLRSFPTITNEFLQNLADEIEKHFKNQPINLISLQDNLDMPVINKFAEYLDEKELKYNIWNNLDVKNAIEKISSLEYLIAMRFHACLIGAKSNVKILGINYDKKVETLAKQIGFGLTELDKPNLAKDIEKIFESKDYEIPEFIFPKITL